MGYAKSYYYTTFQYELIQKFKYLNHKHLFRLKKAVLSFNVKDVSGRKKLAFPLFFQIYTGLKSHPIARHADSSKSGRRVQKGDLAGYKITLRKKELFTFFCKIAEKSNRNNKTDSLCGKHYSSHSFEVKDVLAFAQLGPQYKYMQNVSNLHVCVVVRSSYFEELDLFLKSFHLNHYESKALVTQTRKSVTLPRSKTWVRIPSTANIG